MARNHVAKPTLALIAVAALGGACGSGGGNSASSATTQSSATGITSSSPPTTANYHPTVDPANFSDQITNQYFPLKPGTTFSYDGTRDGKPHHGEVIVTSEKRTIMGVKCVVVRDTVTSNGALVEKTTDWYAQAANGDVWYFGETTAEYVNGAVSNTHGSWEAGVDNAQPGVVMKANPRVGDSYRQEYRPGEAEDMAKILKLDATAKVPAGTYSQVIVTEDTDPLNPDKIDKKQYAPGVGLIHAVRIKTGHREVTALTKVTKG